MHAEAPSSSPGVFALYRSIWRFAAGVRARYLGAMTLLALAQIVKLCIPWLAGLAIDSIQVAGTDQFARAGLLTGAIFLVYALSWSLHGPGRIMERNIGLTVREAMSDALYAKLSRLPLTWHERHHSGELQHRAQQATYALFEFTEGQFLYLQNAINIVGPLVALALMSTFTGGMAIGGYVVLGVVILRFDRSLLRLSERQNAADRRYAAGLLDLLGNISTILSLRLQDASRRLLGKRLREVFEPMRRSISLNEVKWCAVDLLTIGLTWALVVAYAWQTRSRDGQVTLLLGGVFMVYQYSQQAGGVIGTFAANFQNFTRVKTNFASAQPIWDAVEPIAAAAKLPSDWREIEAHSLRFTYTKTDGEPAGVHAASLKLRRGERLAVIGPSGAGKSTLLRLIAGLYQPQHGHYVVDGHSGHAMHDLSSIATLIPQEAEVFEATVRDNLSFGARYPDSAVTEAAYLCAFDAVVDALPNGLATPISERGFNLSGGQRQRLALTRGLLAARKSSLLLLDEPTSALDQVTEARVFERLRRGLANTCVVASVHRMSALCYFDRIVLMADGRIVDSGSMRELLQRQALFRDMFHGAGAPAKTGWRAAGGRARSRRQKAAAAAATP